MYYKDSMTIREIASSCGVNPSTVSRTIKRGRLKIDKTVADAMKFCS